MDVLDTRWLREPDLLPAGLVQPATRSLKTPLRMILGALLDPRIRGPTMATSRREIFRCSHHQAQYGNAQRIP